MSPQYQRDVKFRQNRHIVTWLLHKEAEIFLLQNDLSAYKLPSRPSSANSVGKMAKALDLHENLP